MTNRDLFHSYCWEQPSQVLAKMASASGSIWWCTTADETVDSCIWQPVAESEAALLEHAYRQSWDRLELTLNGKLYVIDPFVSDTETNFATPMAEQGGPVLLVTRVAEALGEGVAASSFLHTINRFVNSLPKLWRETEAIQSDDTLQAPMGCYSGSSNDNFPQAPDVAVGRPSSRSTPEIPSHLDGFRLVSRRCRQRRVTNSIATGQPGFFQADSGAQHMILWRVFPKVDLEACADHHLVRQVLVDGVDVALQHGGKRKLSPAGIALAVAHFMELSFPVRVVVPHWFAHDYRQYLHLFTDSPEELIKALREDDLLLVLPNPDEPSWLPSFSSFRTVRDAQRTVDLCKTFNAVLCSNDFNQFLHLMDENHPLFSDYLYISSRSCLYAFDREAFYHVLDSLGRNKFVDTLFFRGAIH